MKNLEKIVKNYGIGLDVKKLVEKIYLDLTNKSIKNVSILNEKYLILNGINYQFIKSKADNCWKIKKF